jgi:hypothetical protein
MNEVKVVLCTSTTDAKHTNLQNNWSIHTLRLYCIAVTEYDIHKSNRTMSLKLRKRTRSLACILPGVRASAISTCKGHWRKAKDEEDDDRSHLLMEDNTAKPDRKPYDLEKQDDQLSVHEELQPLNDTVSSDGTISCSSRHTPSSKAEAVSPAPGMAPSDSSSLGDTWPQCFPELELDHESMHSISSLPSSLKSMSVSAPNSPYLSAHSSATTSSFYSLSSTSHGSSLSQYSTPVTPTRSSRLPLTSPLPRRPLHRKSQSASNILLPLALPPPPCEQVQTTLVLLKSIKNQIKALKRRESHLSTKLHVQRRERQQMQEQIAHLEARRLRVEALFLRPLPLVLLLPVNDKEYDVCLVSEGQDAWNALPPLMRTALRAATNRRKGAPLLLHFGPTLTQPMAATVSFLPPIQAQEVDLQPLVRQMDFPFWDRVTCGQVLEADPTHPLSSASCQFLFDALMVEHNPLWRDQLTHVVDKKTRRIQWILQAEADSLYYEMIPKSPTAPVSSALVELD